jgi:hypothetical protein
MSESLDDIHFLAIFAPGIWCVPKRFLAIFIKMPRIAKEWFAPLYLKTGLTWTFKSYRMDIVD